MTFLSVVWNRGWDNCVDFVLEILTDKSVLLLLGGDVITLPLHDDRQNRLHDCSAYRISCIPILSLVYISRQVVRTIPHGSKAQCWLSRLWTGQCMIMSQRMCTLPKTNSRTVQCILHVLNVMIGAHRPTVTCLTLKSFWGQGSSWLQLVHEKPSSSRCLDEWVQKKANVIKHRATSSLGDKVAPQDDLWQLLVAFPIVDKGCERHKEEEEGKVAVKGKP